jgi:hypothetical protein
MKKSFLILSAALLLAAFSMAQHHGGFVRGHGGYTHYSHPYFVHHGRSGFSVGFVEAYPPPVVYVSAPPVVYDDEPYVETPVEAPCVTYGYPSYGVSAYVDFPVRHYVPIHRGYVTGSRFEPRIANRSFRSYRR